jgi:hypothetical protein
VAHFCAALLISAVLAAPWHSLLQPGVLLGLVGLFGVMYILRIAYRTKRLSIYTADREDWIWFTILPFVSYLTLLSGAIAIAFAPVQALFVLAASVVMFMFIGIRNAWDIVTFIATGGGDQPTSGERTNGERQRPGE